MTAKSDHLAIRSFLFKRLAPLSPGLHAHFGLAARRSYSEYHFHWLPILLSEVATVARHFPIGITPTRQPMLAAIVGLHDRQSLFIDRMGAWTGAYLPLYLQQMPFHIVHVRDAATGARRPTLCLDVDSAMVDERFPEKIVEHERLSATAARIVAAAEAFDQGAMAAAAFAQAAERAGLTLPLSLIPESADCLALRGLSAVSSARLRDASAQALSPFTSSQLLPVLQACTQSLDNFDILRRLQEERYSEQEAHMRADL